MASRPSSRMPINAKASAPCSSTSTCGTRTSCNLSNSDRSQHLRCLVEYDPIRWNYGGQKVREADILMRLHVVTATAATAEAGGRYQDKALERFDIINGVTQALLSFSFDDGVRQAGTFRQAESATDHNHEQVCDDIESWVAFCRDASGCKIPGTASSVQRFELRPGQ